MAKQRIQISDLAFSISLAALFTWAAWLRMRAPLDPIADPDVWGYLSPAVSKLVGGGFTHAGRNFVYPGFLYLLLRVAGDFRVIAFAQHALGLLAGVVMLLIWQRVRDLVVRPRLPAAVHRWLGLLPVGIYLLAADTIRFEMQIRPEAICGFLGLLNVYLVLQFIYWFFVRENKRAAVLYGIGGVLSVLLLGSVRPFTLMLGKLQVEIRNGLMLVKLPDNILFDPGRTDLKPAGQEAIKQVAQMVQGKAGDFLGRGCRSGFTRPAGACACVSRRHQQGLCANAPFCAARRYHSRSDGNGSRRFC